MWTLYIDEEKVFSSEYKNDVLRVLYGFNEIGDVDLNNHSITAMFWNEQENSYETHTRSYELVRS